ncbi:MAG: diguanylate cyclase [Planctomycetes bacterium]|nr:diguanylate cyclase [Planctomycetota bacterium]
MAEAVTPSRQARTPAAASADGRRGRPPSEARPCLLRIAPEQPWQRVVLRHELTAIDGAALRRHWHETDPDRVLLEPAAGTDRVQVNGQPADRARPLADLDTVSVGETNYRFHQAGGLRHLLRHEEVRARALDPTTGCLVRPVLCDHLAELCADALEGGGPVSIVLFAVDNWADLEQRSAPAVRTAILAAVARVMRGRLRQADLVFTNRAHEFVLVIPGTGADELYGLAERMLRHVEEELIDTAEGTRMVTLSAALLSGPDRRRHPDPEELLGAAGALLESGAHTAASRIIA